MYILKSSRRNNQKFFYVRVLLFLAGFRLMNQSYLFHKSMQSSSSCKATPTPQHPSPSTTFSAYFFFFPFTCQKIPSGIYNHSKNPTLIRSCLSSFHFLSLSLYLFLNSSFFPTCCSLHQSFSAGGAHKKILNPTHML